MALICLWLNFWKRFLFFEQNSCLFEQILDFWFILWQEELDVWLSLHCWVNNQDILTTSDFIRKENIIMAGWLPLPASVTALLFSFTRVIVVCRYWFVNDINAWHRKRCFCFNFSSFAQHLMLRLQLLSQTGPWQWPELLVGVEVDFYGKMNKMKVGFCCCLLCCCCYYCCCCWRMCCRCCYSFWLYFFLCFLLWKNTSK